MTLKKPFFPWPFPDLWEVQPCLWRKFRVWIFYDIKTVFPQWSFPYFLVVYKKVYWQCNFKKLDINQKTYCTESPAWSTMGLVLNWSDVTFCPPIDTVWNLQIWWCKESGSFPCQFISHLVSIEYFFYFLWCLNIKQSLVRLNLPQRQGAHIQKLAVIQNMYCRKPRSGFRGSVEPRPPTHPQLF